MSFMWAWNTLTQTQGLKAVTHPWAAPADAATAAPHWGSWTGPTRWSGWVPVCVHTTWACPLSGWGQTLLCALAGRQHCLASGTTQQGTPQPEYIHVFMPLKPQVQLSINWKSRFHLTENTLSQHQKDQSANAVKEIITNFTKKPTMSQPSSVNFSILTTLLFWNFLNYSEISIVSCNGGEKYRTQLWIMDKQRFKMSPFCS